MMESFRQLKFLALPIFSKFLLHVFVEGCQKEIFSLGWSPSPIEAYLRDTLDPVSDP